MKWKGGGVLLDNLMCPCICFCFFFPSVYVHARVYLQDCGFIGSDL
jgi:hypothetical protein